jgi:hypothetical protein
MPPHVLYLLMLLITQRRWALFLYAFKTFVGSFIRPSRHLSKTEIWLIQFFSAGVGRLAVDLAVEVVALLAGFPEISRILTISPTATMLLLSSLNGIIALS